MAQIQQIFCFNENHLQLWFSGPAWLWFCSLWLQRCSTGSSWCPETGRGSCRMNWRLRPLSSSTRSRWTWSSGWSRTNSLAGSTSSRWTEYELDVDQRLSCSVDRKKELISLFDLNWVGSFIYSYIRSQSCCNQYFYINNGSNVYMKGVSRSLHRIMTQLCRCH